MSRQNLLSKNCLPVLLRGRTSFPQRGILSNSLPLLSDLSIRIPQFSSQIPWCGLSTERRGRESQPLITEWSPAVRSRVSFTKKTLTVKRLLASCSHCHYATTNLNLRWETAYSNGAWSRLLFHFIFYWPSKHNAKENLWLQKHFGWLIMHKKRLN